MSYIKIIEGTLKKDMDIIDITQDKKEKISNIYTTVNGNLEELQEAKAGDIVVVTKISSLKTGDTIAEKADAIPLPQSNCQNHKFIMQLFLKIKGTKKKIASCLNKVSEEDPTIHWYRNPETKQTLVGGQGELHIKTIKNK